jgi:hypothetical protein
LIGNAAEGTYKAEVQEAFNISTQAVVEHLDDESNLNNMMTNSDHSKTSHQADEDEEEIPNEVGEDSDKENDIALDANMAREWDL